MASPPYNIISEIIDRVHELSNAVGPLTQRNNSVRMQSQRTTSTASTSNQNVSTTTVEEEVARVFNRPSQSQFNATAPACSTLPVSTPSLRGSHNSGPLFGLRRNFQGRSGGSKPKKPKKPSGPFLRDVVLLTGPEDKIVPRQGARIWLSEHGHILSGFEFYKEWNECQVELALKEAFEEKITSHTDFEILMSVHSALVAPTLAPGQKGLSGMMIHRVFKGKPIYVRPADEIIDSTHLPWSLQNNKQTKEDFDEPRENEAHFQSTISTWAQPLDLPQVQPTNLARVQPNSLSQVQPNSLPRVQSTNLVLHVPHEVQSTNLPQVQQNSLPQVQPNSLSQVQPNSLPPVQSTNLPLVQSTNLVLHVPHEVQSTNLPQVQQNSLPQVQSTIQSTNLVLPREVQSTNLPLVQSTNLVLPREVQSTNLPLVQSTNLVLPHEVQSTNFNLPLVQSTNLLQVQPNSLPPSQSDQSLEVQLTGNIDNLETDAEIQLPSAVPHVPDSVEGLNSITHTLGNQVEHILELDDDVLEHKNIIVHREMIRDEVVEIFQDPEILKHILHVTIIGNDGNPEKGSGRGVTLDMLTNFWQHVFDSLTVGTQEKIPSIRHDYQKNHWQAIARVLVYGYAREKYFPIRISPAFIAAALFGEESVSNDFLLHSFQLYISSEEKETLLSALAGDLSLDDEDLLDFLSNYKCYRCITKNNISQTVNELAHQEILQKPRYIIDCFSNTLGLLKVYSPFQSVDSLKEMYAIKKPTSRKVIKLLAANPSTEAEHACLDHLKRYIRSLEGSAVNQFLAFVTGSDVIVCDNINVSFVELVGVSRRPIVRTCGPLLELPSTYQTYNELAEEFNFVIKDTLAWGFTIV